MMNPTILNLNENILGVQVTNFNLDVEVQYSAVVYGVDENFLKHCGKNFGSSIAFFHYYR
mgnify:CR=1 FL=1